MASSGRAVVESVDLRAFMRTFPTGVAIVATLGVDGVPRGMTCTSMCSVSLAPPIVLVCLREGSPTLDAVLASGTFALNLIHEEGRGAAELFASGLPDRFERIRWVMDADAAGPHLPDDAHAVADSRVLRSELLGDHRVVYGQVDRVVTRPDPRPLMYGFRRYGRWSAL